MELQVDPKRIMYPDTGYYVRVKVGNRWTNADISQLTKESLLEWLHTFDNGAEQVLLGMLGHNTGEAL